MYKKGETVEKLQYTKYLALLFPFLPIYNYFNNKNSLLQF